MEDLQRVLREHELLKGLSPDQSAVIVGCVKNVRFKPGEFLLREGDPADVFFLLRSGDVALELHVPGRGAVQMEQLGPGDMLGLSWVQPHQRVVLDARAIGPVVALAFDGACLRDKMAADPRLGFVLLEKLLAETVTRLQRVRLQRADLYSAG